ncbi:MAG: CHAT domain-containing protein [Chloroflexi bacterium]|nr:CHAT domain-containing protein [Chloroflexota bacterium]
MYLHEVAMDTFVVLQADWPAGKARHLIESLNPTHVIVHRTDGPRHLYYLFTRSLALGRLAAYHDHVPVREALDLHEHTSTPVADAYARAEGAPDRAVVIEEGRVVGFFDAAVAPRGPTRRDLHLPERGSVEPVPRSLVVDFPEQVRLAETVSLLVSLSAEAVAAAALPLALAVGTQVDIVVQPRRGFDLVGPAEGSLVIADPEETLPLQFKLKATGLGPAQVRILAFQQGQPLGMITLAPTVIAATETVSEPARSHEQPMTPISVHVPDLSLLILEHQSQGKPAITFRLSAVNPSLGLNLKLFGPVVLRMPPLEYFNEFFQDIENLPLRTAQDKARAEQRLAGKGLTLFEKAMPEDLQVLLWSLRERIRSVQVQSEEPWIPWELCKLQGKEDGRVVEGPFLCEAFDMTRWLPQIGFQPTLTLQKMALVVPQDSGLPFAASERDYVLSLAKSGRHVKRVPARFLELTKALARGECDGWHFTGHGGFRAPDPNRSAMLLENREELTPEDLSGVVQNLGLTHPLVFLNACQIGRGAMSLTGIGGFAERFLRAGAGAFIGAYWSVYDQAAHDFAKALYSRLLGGMAIGQAVREARAAVKPLGDPTWLTYTLFADPLAVVQ